MSIGSIHNLTVAVVCILTVAAALIYHVLAGHGPDPALDTWTAAVLGYLLRGQANKSLAGG